MNERRLVSPAEINERPLQWAWPGNPLLNDDDRRALAELQSQLSVVRDRVRGVARALHRFLPLRQARHR